MPGSRACTAQVPVQVLLDDQFKFVQQLQVRSAWLTWRLQLSVSNGCSQYICVSR